MPCVPDWPYLVILWLQSPKSSFETILLVCLVLGFVVVVVDDFFFFVVVVAFFFFLSPFFNC